MAGTTKGGNKAAITLKQRYGDDYYRTIGRRGGKMRRKPYNHFEELKKTDPQALSEIAAKAGHAGRRTQ